MALAFWGGEYDWKEPENFVSEFDSFGTNLLEGFVSENYYARTNLIKPFHYARTNLLKSLVSEFYHARMDLQHRHFILPGDSSEIIRVGISFC